MFEIVLMPLKKPRMPCTAAEKPYIAAGHTIMIMIKITRMTVELMLNVLERTLGVRGCVIKIKCRCNKSVSMCNTM